MNTLEGFFRRNHQAEVAKYSTEEKRIHNQGIWLDRVAKVFVVISLFLMFIALTITTKLSTSGVEESHFIFGRMKEGTQMLLGLGCIPVMVIAVVLATIGEKRKKEAAMLHEHNFKANSIVQ